MRMAGTTEGPLLDLCEGGRVPLVDVLCRVEDQRDTRGPQSTQRQHLRCREAEGLLVQIDNIRPRLPQGAAQALPVGEQVGVRPLAVHDGQDNQAIASPDGYLLLHVPALFVPPRRSHDREIQIGQRRELRS